MQIQLFALSMYYKGESVSEIDEHCVLEDTYYRSQTEEVVFSAFKKKKISNLIIC